MSVTFQTLINEASDYVKVDLEDGDSEEAETRLKSALNEAKNLVSQRFKMATSEDVALTNGCFSVDDLTNTLSEIVSITKGGAAVYSEQRNGGVYCDAESPVTVEYNYIPDDMVNESDEYPFPAVVSWRILCYFAAARYYEIKGTATSLNKYRYWQNEFENGMNALKGGSKYARRRVKAVYNL